VVVRFTAARYDEIAARIGHNFKHRAYLRHALTHASTRRKHDDYERLEFLGDRVLGLVIAEELFKLHPADREGHMSARHSTLVRGETCAGVGRALVLQDFIVMGESERNKGLDLNATVLGDVVEALIGGIYLDGGLEAARAFILRNWQHFLESPGPHEKDAKTFLQEWALARSFAIPAYRVVSRDGPEHAPVFVVAVEIERHEPIQGSGKNKRLAEQDAASRFLAREKIRT
jgi:ribonuclease III